MRFFLACLLVLTLCGTAQAQPAFDSVPAGTRVRVSILVPPKVDSTGFRSGDRHVGTLLRYDRSTLELNEVERAIPWTLVNRLERSTGHGSAGKGALIGCLTGLVAGVVVGDKR